MGYAFTGADVSFLRSGEGASALRVAAGLPLTAGSMIADLTALRGRFGERVGGLVETVLLRRRARAKLPTDAADSWLFTDDGLQQATPWEVARHRARRLEGREVHDLTCSIGTELAALAGSARTVIGSDLDPVRLAMAAHNAPGALLLRADALRPATRDVPGREVVLLADPARRSGGRRRHRPEDLQPALTALLAACAGRDLAVKCAPGLDFDALDWAGEIEVVSLDGAVKEACLWTPGLTSVGVRRRASILRTVPGGVVTETVTDADPEELPEPEPGEWIIDPDGAIVRAGLVRHWAARHGLRQLDPRIAYLTGERPPAGVAGFRVRERLPLTEKILRRRLAESDCGSLEILVRGVDVDPDALRRRLRLRGGQALALVITRIGRAGVVFLCEPRSAAEVRDATLDQ